MSLKEEYTKFIAEGEEVLTEEKKWIQKAISKPGALHKQLGVPEGKKIPSKKLAVKPGMSPKLKKRIILAKTLKKISKKRQANEALTMDEQALVTLAESYAKLIATKKK